MTNTTIFAIIAMTSIILLGTSVVQAADHGDAPLISNDQGADTASLFPPWFNNNLQWYLEGSIDEQTLANAFKDLADREIIILDKDRADRVRELSDENQMLRQKIGVDPPPDPDIVLRPVPGALPELPGFPDACPENYSPVCGRDGRTYPNQCFADQAGVGIVYDGECRDRPHRECPSGYDWVACAGICVPHGDDKVCPNNEKWNEHAGQCTPESGDCLCTREYAPVCGTDGVTYGNKCEAGCADSEIKHEGECRDDSCLCTKEYVPVCGTDGVTYGNKCEAGCADSEIAYEGVCRADLQCDSNAECMGDDVCRDGICQQACSIQCVRADPVCGEDGKTYACGLADAQCHGVEVAYVGECLAIRAAP